MKKAIKRGDVVKYVVVKYVRRGWGVHLGCWSSIEN